jgi:signal-transduction protein with cAMP-binding, CBS, and nucleotidyltransferase domain
VIPTRRDYSLDRLRTLGERLDPVRPLLGGKPICLYATGSYGRLEGWSGSDVDLFFLYDGEDESDRFPWTTFTQLASCLTYIRE